MIATLSFVSKPAAARSDSAGNWLLHRSSLALRVAVSAILALAPLAVSGDDGPNFETQIKPILTRYCTGCHNEDDREGNLSLESYSALKKGGEQGPVLVSGNANASRFIGVLTGKDEPAMPPEGETRPAAEEIALLARWVNSGGYGPDDNAPRDLVVPELAPGSADPAITAVAASPDGKTLAVAKFGVVELQSAKTREVVRKLEGHPGKINDVRFTVDSAQLVVATGVAGLRGEVHVWNVADGKHLRTFTGHRDTIYVAVPSPDGKTLATGSYDRKIILWDFSNGEQKHVLSGHNGAIFDLAFSPDSHNLASASGDTTVKIWHVESGERLDTRSEPLKEQYSVAFSPDGRTFAAGGADNRVRVWQFVSRDKLQINPRLHARYGHDGAITRLRYSADGRQLVTVALDQTIKVWHAPSMLQLETFPRQSDAIEAMAINSVNRQVVVGRMDGSISVYVLPAADSEPIVASTARRRVFLGESTSSEMGKVAEVEPNDDPQQASEMTLPVQITGVIHSDRQVSDIDVFRFRAEAGHSWILEINAAREKSPLDSKIEIVDAIGEPVPRVMLQAVRDSYFTFRGKSAWQIDDFRLHNWREMQLNQMLYANGEVVRLYHYPRGPDSGFKVYPNFGGRHGYFDTTPLSHALGEVCYIVEAYQPTDTILPNGLPIFQINFENDDDSQRKMGVDSRLTFIAPRTSDYFVRVRDVRGYQGEDYKYRLNIQRPKPDFEVKMTGENPTVPAGAGRRFGIQLTRLDGFKGAVNFEIDGLPPGFSVQGPLMIDAGQYRASGTILAAADAPKPTEENAKKTTLTATTAIRGEVITRQVGTLGEIKLGEVPKLTVSIEPQGDIQTSDGMPVIVMPAGKTIRCTLRVQRNGHDGVIPFGHEEAAWNLPQGVYVDNIGLNGVLMLAEQSERTVFITSEPSVPSSQRPIFFEAAVAEKPSSPPVMLRIVNGDQEDGS
ncbi:MAG: hypothetical protein N2C12_12910 [Planctomycetales bacterium]